MPPQVIHVRNASKVAAALASKNCQKILDYLGKHKDGTETQLSKELYIPLSTVHYNMKVLSEAKLIIDDEYRYSAKGKEVTHYRINKNPIVIVQEEQQLDLLKAIVPAAIIAAGIGVAYSLLHHAPQAASESYGMLADTAAPALMKAAPTAAQLAPATQPSMLPWFIFGIVATVVLSFLLLLVYRAWNRRE